MKTTTRSASTVTVRCRSVVGVRLVVPISGFMDLQSRRQRIETAGAGLVGNMAKVGAAVHSGRRYCPLPRANPTRDDAGMTIPDTLVQRYRDAWKDVFGESIDVDFARASLTELTLFVARAEYPELVHRLGVVDSERRSN